MQMLLRILNVVLGPVLTLLFAAHFAGLMILKKDAGDAVGAALAGVIMLAFELGLTQGPKRSKWLRRWLDRRAAFEGIWLQEVIKGNPSNRVAVFSVDYEREGDTYAVRGHAYKADGKLWAKWESTNVFLNTADLTATYLWAGEVLGQETPTDGKVGLARLSLRRPPIFSLPMSGEGSVSHVGELARLEFRLERITSKRLKELGLPFAERDLRLDANREEAKLVDAELRKLAGTVLTRA